MKGIGQTLSDHHRLCDELFATCEAAARGQRWSVAQDMYRRFADGLDAHMRAEESILFPAFESATGITGGPTQAMREEHMQMRDILERLREVTSPHQTQIFADLGQTLLILMQQDNLKEENVLYPLCDRCLMQGAGELADRIAEMLTAT